MSERGSGITKTCRGDRCKEVVPQGGNKYTNATVTKRLLLSKGLHDKNRLGINEVQKRRAYIE